MDLTKSESSILEILLNAEVPLSKSAIIEHSPRNKCWKDGSIHILLMNITQKAEPYKIFSQLICEDIFTDEELDALEQLIKSRK